jgi:hypothetical protein
MAIFSKFVKAHVAIEWAQRWLFKQRMSKLGVSDKRQAFQQIAPKKNANHKGYAGISQTIILGCGIKPIH